MNDELILRARAWMVDDPDPETRRELDALLVRARAGDSEALSEIAERFTGTLEFGTAGLRGVLGAGPNRMNRAVVIRTARALGEYLLEQLAGRHGEAFVRVVIGYDGRRYSRVFAEDTAEVLAALGIRSSLFDDFAPTPLVAFAVTELRATAGIMVTASHNPAAYNGYKVYWGDGAQIVPPHDAAIAEKIVGVGGAATVPRVQMFPVDTAIASDRLTMIGGEIRKTYVERVVSLAGGIERAHGVRIAYTPMHGVGGRLAMACFAAAGFDDVHMVPEQAEPDADFPTVVFPNPEEAGAMDRAFAVASRVGAELVLANDPDADRLAVAIPCVGGAGASEFCKLTGNQVGVLLADYLIAACQDRGHALVVTTIVSSPMLRVMAEQNGVGYAETLTGFKWIAHVALEARRSGREFLFGYEEALGYSVGDLVRDKDGISTAVIFAKLAMRLKESESSVLQRLEELYRRYGLFVSSQRSVTMKGIAGSAAIDAMMARLRDAPPGDIGGWKVVTIRDYDRRERLDMTGARHPLDLPRSNVLAYDLDSGGRVIVRPSGTEPKVKLYFDHVEMVKVHEPFAVAEGRAATALRTLEGVMVPRVVGA